MSKYLLAVCCSMLLCVHAYACDACSCTSMNTLDGQLFPTNKTFFGSSLNYAHQLDGVKNQVHNLSYNVFVAYSFAKRFQLMANVPFQHNITRSTDNKKDKQLNMGDASLLFSVMTYSTPAEKKALSKNTLILRTGLKFPTGYYDETGSSTNLGTKSYDLLFAAQYIYERNKHGVNMSVTTRLNTQNKYNYKYGNQYNASIFYFVNRLFKRHNYMPFAGVSVEHFSKDISNGFKRTYSGGTGLYGFGGLQWSYNDKISFFIKGELPFRQEYLSVDGNVFTNIKAQFQLSYFIQTKQKIKKNIKL